MLDLKALKKLMKGIWGCWDRLPFYVEENLVTDWFVCNLLRESVPKLLFENIKRRVYFIYAGHFLYYSNKITIEDNRLLWIIYSKNIGDCLMRLSAIKLLNKNGYQVDLLAIPVITELFLPGQSFVNVFRLGVDEEYIKDILYDKVIVDGIQTRPLRVKNNVQPRTSFVTEYDFFHYARNDYNIVLFSWYRMQSLLQLKVENSPVLGLQVDLAEASKNLQHIDLPKNYIAFVMGGRETSRIYSHWAEVIRGVHFLFPEQVFVLLGSENGLSFAKLIESEFPVINLVAKLSLQETMSVIQTATLITCADGGLLHIANALNIPSVGLFATVRPEHRYTYNDNYVALYDEHLVSNIEAGSVINAIKKCWLTVNILDSNLEVNFCINIFSLIILHELLLVNRVIMNDGSFV